MPVETLYRRATKLNRTLKHSANDPTLQTLKIISKEREDHLTCESLRRSLDIAPRAKLILQQPITFKELFVCLDQIFATEEENGNMLYHDLELIQDQYWNKPIDTSVTSVDNTLFVSRLGQTMIFKGELRRLVEEKR
ncbi:hypothetical protein WICPIJ_005834 [Wickerhamomyces pijperi]|uniref:Uncharacterized protein n=1 Tax=Wickerhamomyces pijperi TaxID=599730 RepID=A0A9P8Q5I6_WICPI|nr:hypothetical protein WICPIJ_005834 [Wickerhamomyces pijperi]